MGLDDDPYWSYCVDEIIFAYRNKVINTMSEKASMVPGEDRNGEMARGIKKRVLDTFLNFNPYKTEEEPEQKPQQFRDPATMIRKKR